MGAPGSQELVKRPCHHRSGCSVGGRAPLEPTAPCGDDPVPSFGSSDLGRSAPLPRGGVSHGRRGWRIEPGIVVGEQAMEPSRLADGLVVVGEIKRGARQRPHGVPAPCP